MGILHQPPVPAGFTGTRLGVCNLCEAICGLELTLEDGAVTGIRGNPDDPLSRGYICPKGVSLADVLRRPRPAAPSRAPGPGPDGGRHLGGARRGTRPSTWSPTGWPRRSPSTAATPSASTSATPTPTPSASAPTAPGSCARCGPTTASAPRPSTRCRTSSWRGRCYGHQLMIAIPDLDRTQLFLVVGANPMASNGSLMTVPDFPKRVRELKRRGGRMVVLDPRRTETAKVADEHHFVRPGTDAAVLLAMLHVLRRPRAWPAPRRTSTGSSASPTSSRPSPPSARPRSRASTPTTIRALARELAGAEPGCRLRPDGRVHAGLRDPVPVGDRVPQPAVRPLRLPRRRDVHRAGGRHRRAAHRRPRVAATAGAAGCATCPEFAGELPASVMAEEMREPGEGQVRAMVTVAGNPVLSTPDGPRPGRGARRPRLHGRRSTSTSTRRPGTPTWCCRRPARSSATSTTWCSTASRCATPPAGRRRSSRAATTSATTGRSSAALATRIAERLGSPLSDDAAGQLAAAPADLVELLLDSGGRATAAELVEHPEGVDLGPLRPTMPERLQTPDQRIDLVPDLLVGDLDRLTAWLADLEATPPGRRRAGADRPAPPARLQLLAAQHDPAHQGPGPPPAAHAPRRPRRPRHRRRRHRRGHLTGRLGRGRRGRGRRHDARRRLAPPRLRPPAARHPPSARQHGRRASRSTTSPTPTCSTPCRATPRSTECR